MFFSTRPLALSTSPIIITYLPQSVILKNFLPYVQLNSQCMCVADDCFATILSYTCFSGITRSTPSTSATTSSHSVGVLPVMITIICLVLLFLPLEEDVFSSFPPYIRVSVNMKILAAYILGEYISSLALLYCCFTYLFLGGAPWQALHL